jgi:hypothetical protein
MKINIDIKRIEIETLLNPNATGRIMFILRWEEIYERIAAQAKWERNGKTFTK